MIIFYLDFVNLDGSNQCPDGYVKQTGMLPEKICGKWPVFSGDVHVQVWRFFVRLMLSTWGVVQEPSVSSGLYFQAMFTSKY